MTLIESKIKIHLKKQQITQHRRKCTFIVVSFVRPSLCKFFYHPINRFLYCCWYKLTQVLGMSYFVDVLYVSRPRYSGKLVKFLSSNQVVSQVIIICIRWNFQNEDFLKSLAAVLNEKRASSLSRSSKRVVLEVQREFQNTYIYVRKEREKDDEE